MSDLISEEQRQVLDLVLATFTEYIKTRIIPITIAQLEVGMLNWMKHLTQERAIYIINILLKDLKNYWISFSGIYRKKFYGSGIITVIPYESEWSDWSMGIQLE